MMSYHIVLWYITLYYITFRVERTVGRHRPVLGRVEQARVQPSGFPLGGELPPDRGEYPKFWTRNS